MLFTTMPTARFTGQSAATLGLMTVLFLALLGCQKSNPSARSRVVESPDTQQDLGTKWTTELIRRGTPSQQHLDALSQHYADLSRRAGEPAAEASICELQVINYTRIAKAYPDWPELLYRLASQRLVLQRLLPERMEELDQAIVELQHLIAIAAATDRSADEASGYFQLARTYKHQGDTLRTIGQSAATAERYDLAIETFNRVLELRPERIDALGENILIYLARDQVDAAIAALKLHAHKVQDMRRRGKLAEMLGALYVESGQNELARREFHTALGLDPKLMGAYLHLAQIERAAGNNQAAIRVLANSVLTEPNFIGGYVRLGSMLRETNQMTAAAEAFQRALNVPQSSAVFIGMLPSRALYRNHLYYQAAEQLVYLHELQGDPTKALQMAEVAAGYQSIETPLQQAMDRLQGAAS